MKKKRIVFPNNKGQKLVGYLYENTSKTLLLMCHGLDTLSDFPGVNKVFKAYYQTGCSVFYFDFTGYGESEGRKSLSIKQRVADIGSIVEYFSKDYKEIILYGISLAGMVVAIAATKFKHITKLIVINGLFSINITQLNPQLAIAVYMHLLINPWQLSEISYWRKYLQIEKINIPVLVVYGEKDEIINPKQSLNFYRKLNTNKTLLSVSNGDHALMKEEYEYITKKIPLWIAKQVR